MTSRSGGFETCSSSAARLLEPPVVGRRSSHDPQELHPLSPQALRDVGATVGRDASPGLVSLLLLGVRGSRALSEE